MITIVDYGSSNLRSVENMILHVGGNCDISNDPEQIRTAKKIILPGVGAFDSGMIALRNSYLLDALNESVLVNGNYILGICLGMQLMTKKSQEGKIPGLGWIDAEVIRFSFEENTNLKIPHMGWNMVEIKKDNPLLMMETEQRFYFVHSYFVQCSNIDDVIATCYHGSYFAAAFWHNNIFGVQFHPEKSHRFGMAMLKSFVEL